MSQKTYWKDIRQSFSNSKGRVISIASLMALGSFALVGLKVSSPDMQVTGEHFFANHQTADLTVIGDYGLSQSEQALIATLGKDTTVEYGYLKDVVIEGTNTAVRIFSKPNEVSTYEVVEGHLPERRGEIALTAAYEGSYQLGDTLKVTEKESINGKMVLKDHTYTIVGFVNSSEILSRVNLGQSTAGSGELDGYAVVTSDTFDSEVYMIARLLYPELRDKSPYSQAYLDEVYQEKTAVQSLFTDEPSKRLDAIKQDYQEKIDDGQAKIKEVEDKLADAVTQLSEGRDKINEGEQQLSDAEDEVATNEVRLEDARVQLADGRQQLEETGALIADGRRQLDAGYQELADKKALLDDGAAQLDNAKQQLTTARTQLDRAAQEISSKDELLKNAQAQLASSKQQLDDAATQLASAQTQIQTNEAALTTAKTQLDAVKQDLDRKQSQLDTAKEQAAQIPDEALRTQTLAQLAQQESVLQVAWQSYETKEAEYTTNATKLEAAKQQYTTKEADYKQGQETYESKSAEYEAGMVQLSQAKATLAQKEAEYQAGTIDYAAKESEYQAGLSAYQDGQSLLASKQEEYEAGVSAYQAAIATYNEKNAEYQDGIVKIEEAKATIASKEHELEDAKQTLADKQKEYDDAKAQADPEIADKKKELQEAQERVDQLLLPTYHVYTRREIPGYEGYVSYENNASIISNVGNIFPVVLYFIASLVTFVTMARFVEEERIKAGTYRALGYQTRDIVRKFVIYGLVTSMVGTAIGVTAGHLLLPRIIYTTYSSKLVVAPLEYHFYPGMTLLAVVLGLLSAVLPAYLVAKKELSEKPAQLLLPKPPTNGSKILLERITPLWSRMSFTQKVTARNIFRYKQRMFMTIFGVCGSIALLFAGLGVRSSIADLNNRQFVDIIKYDMIVANNAQTNATQEAAIDDFLNSAAVKAHIGVHYETVSKVAGAKNDEQSITTLVFNNQSLQQLSDYITLENRQSKETLSLADNQVVISEKLANLLGVTDGDTITVTTNDKQEVSLTITGITEMYMSHFLFMNDTTYKKAFGKMATENANMVLLNDNSATNTESVASQFMALEGVKGVVQNTTLKAQVETIVDSLNRVMGVMIGASVLLAVVVLYNLTNVNVSERIRELSTIKVLGFYNQEVTLYIYRETIYLSLVGILVGFVLGLGLHGYMVSIIPPDSVMFNPAVGGLIYAVPATVVVVILAVLGVVVNHWLKRVDMLEALKSVE